MDFTFTPEEIAWRHEVRGFLEEHSPADAPYEEMHHDWDFYRKLAGRGWLTLDWPEQFRGSPPATKVEHAIFLDEYGYSWTSFGHVLLSATTLVAHTIMKFGSPEQQELLLPGIAKGEFVCAQGFSEPDAGSDIASLRTRAERDGDHYVLNGAKVWSSSAHYAKWYLVAARTDPDSTRHRGLSVFLVDLEQPGIEIRPLHLVAGGRNNAVWLDNVRVHESMLVGTEGEGWVVMQNLLAEEHGGENVVVPEAAGRVGSGREPIRDHVRGGELGRVIDELARYLTAHGIDPEGRGRPLWHRLARLRQQVMQWQLRVFHEASLADRRYPGEPMRYMECGFVAHRELFGEVAAAARDILGPDALRERVADGFAPLRGRIAWMLRAAPVMTVAGGTQEVAKNVLARHQLGLPKSY